MSASTADVLAGHGPARPSLRAHLDAGQYTALWRRLGLGEKPVLLDTPDHGDTYAARDAADAAALERARDAGWVDHHGDVHPDLADALAVLRAPRHELDARVRSGRERTVRLAGTRGELDVVAGLGPDGGLVVHAGPPGDLAGALLRDLPAAPALPGVALDVPADAVLGVPDPDERRRRLRAAGVAPSAVERLRALWADPPRRLLQCGAARRDDAGRRHRAVRVLTVVDAVPGRVLVHHDRATGRVAFVPLGAAAFSRELRALLAELEPGAT